MSVGVTLLAVGASLALELVFYNLFGYYLVSLNRKEQQDSFRACCLFLLASEIICSRYEVSI